MKKIIKLIVEENNLVKRLDSFITQQLSDISRTRVKNLILNGSVKINNKTDYNPSKKISIKDNIDILIPSPTKTDIQPYNYKINVVFEDKDLILINKPPGLVIHPGAGNKDNTLVNALVNYCKENLSTIGES